MKGANIHSLAGRTVNFAFLTVLTIEEKLYFHALVVDGNSSNGKYFVF